MIAPAGTVTFLFTDIEGSTALWERYPDAMRMALARHDSLARETVESSGGHIFKLVGDGVCAAFTGARAALDAALGFQRALLTEPWGPAAIKARTGLHTGEAEMRDGDYFGTAVNRAARVMALAHGGQVLLSAATTELLRGNLPEAAQLVDMGEHRLKGLLNPERIWQVSVPGLRSEFPPLVSLNAHRNNLPVQLTSFIGRESEIKAVKRLLETARLVTLTGPGGTGKTRLSLQVAAELLDTFPDGVWFVELAPISDPSLVRPAIAHVLGLSAPSDEALRDELSGYLRDKKILLVLDNFEQVVAAATVVRDLLAAPDVRALVSSREMLSIAGEQEYAVPLLSLPDPGRPTSLAQLTQCESVRLFIERAQAVKSDFAINSDNAPAVAEICYRLDGLPLAIELAAARVRLLPPQHMLPQLSNRLRFLTSSARDLPRRQQTLRGAIDWSHDLLSADEQALFRRFACFAGGATLEAVEAVCNPDGATNVLAGVESLANKSLLRQYEAHGEPRFTMLEMVREYAREKLEQSGEALRQRELHLDCYLAVAERAEPLVYAGPQAEWLNPLDAERDNVRAALDWALAHDPARALRLTGAAMLCWSSWALAEAVDGRRLLTAALAAARPLAAAAALQRARALALMTLGIAAGEQGDNGFARVCVTDSIAIFRALGERQRLAFALSVLGLSCMLNDDQPASRDALEESIALSRASGDTWLLGRALSFLGVTTTLSPGSYAAARDLFLECIRLFQQLDDQLAVAIAYQHLGRAACDVGDYGPAREYYALALPVIRASNKTLFLNMAVTGLADIARHTDDFAEARGHYHQLIGEWQRLGNRGAIARVLECLAFVDMREGRTRGATGSAVLFRHAALLLGAAEALREAAASPMSANERVEYGREVMDLQALAGESAVRAAWALGRTLTPAQAQAAA
ncbi:MAG: AAA family ATPase [Chloroflexi bacterium]|nr:AAA family ATPase [Chloroflexota bacterium]